MSEDDKSPKSWAELIKAVGNVSIATILVGVLALMVWLDYQNEKDFNQEILQVRKQQAANSELAAKALKRQTEIYERHSVVVEALMKRLSDE